MNKGFFGSLKDHIIDLIQTLVVFGAIFTVIYLFVAQPHKVSGSSMIPTFQNGDYIITDKLSYKLGQPKKGDIIVLKNPRDESQDFIKRIIVLPGDTIKISGRLIYVNDTLQSEQYLPKNTPTASGAILQEGETVKAGPNQYFVLGDNRTHSSDSREWGSITREEIVGKAFFRYWPPQSFGFIKS
ncbi:signal peptidase I [Candidatus Daviesbacteria bacterium RIFCSPLOWO2_01_FULL_38_10]|nr:MAG: signal peptidase I [Candidatus Daviesbacteria bacterium RIFCSPHIGHO2_02_FULL_39_41]OGE27453.1 MAG: signal peptidase I [Candidatus Daviesbacteria bacterium RIFCSPHIGHO2_01_FULL_38_8b]OGE37175.1 MAG: signal peptidase I [Candidatus Daviesbacteria bacterium RIFCSPLOWO2_01_FULL_38_10]OGE45314.1 MAG: signal peptidase I [Candidatus Daviesbacteria bacterium RIFCSPHIGHO2_12_FULL_38_25]OGE68793.1 MAG: signal peptidase I [Candidatus Daviesbacteria bacterium RIFCSPLOWO2_02_FULL_38_18]OGE73363.1 MA